MTAAAHLWAIGYDTTERAEQVRDEVARLGDKKCLILLDSAVAVRYPDGTVTLDGEPIVAAVNVHRHTFAGFLAGLALGGPPLTGAAVGALLRCTGTAASKDVGIDDDFICEVAGLIKPATSALFVLDREGDMHAILRAIRGLGGTVLKTNVDLKRAKQIQSALADAAPDSSCDETEQVRHSAEDRR
jgi:uncharacterized membrane protein